MLHGNYLCATFDSSLTTKALMTKRENRLLCGRLRRLERITRQAAYDVREAVEDLTEDEDRNELTADLQPAEVAAELDAFAGRCRAAWEKYYKITPTQ